LENWKRQIFEVARGVITAKMGRRDILNCDRFFYLQNWGDELSEIALGGFIKKEGKNIYFKL